MPLISPREMVDPITSLMIILTNNNPNKMKTNDFDGIKYILPPFISNLDVLIKKTEKITPTKTASNTWSNSTRKTGNKNINAPVLINNGGNIIFLTDAGFLDAFNRMNIIEVAIIAAIMVLAASQNISNHSSPHQINQLNIISKIGLTINDPLRLLK